MNPPENPKPVDDPLSRRKALKILVGSAGAAVTLPVLGPGASSNPHARCHLAPATLASLPACAPKFFNPQQISTLEALTETIIPADDHSPGAKAARVWEYIDEIVADSNEKTKSTWAQGLASVDSMSEREYGKKFALCAEEQKIALLETVSRNEDHPTTAEEKFFGELKKATIDGYYTSPIGIHQELEYQGNTALAEFPGCTHPEHKSDQPAARPAALEILPRSEHTG